MIGRRGFIGALLAGGAALAADPEALIWRPGKLISIPPKVHVPTAHLLQVSAYLPDDVVSWPQERWNALIVEPAACALDGAVRRRVRDSGGAPARFRRLELPKAMDIATQGPHGRLPMMRLVRGYDPVRREWLMSAACDVVV